MSFRAKRTVYHQPWSQRLIFLLLGACAYAIMRYTAGISLWKLPVTPVTESAGVAVCTLGLAWAVHARITLGTNWSGFITLKENHELIQSGPYRFTRHPIYTGIVVAVAGTMLALLPSVRGLIGWAVITTAFIIKLFQEEKLMRQQFPEAYPAYKSRVRARLIPFIW
jgi:protein-S-isoprenylcysteine O-methyltransferase Ste14